jgi:hypothetical protein
VIRPSSIKEWNMEKDTKTANGVVLAAKLEECADLILLRSKDQILRVKGSFAPEHKAYMALALVASEAIQAFVALDESLK